MGFGRLRNPFRREPTRQELYLRLARGLNIEQDYQAWIETWERYGPETSLPPPVLPLILVLFGTPSRADSDHWQRLERETGAIQVARGGDPLDARRMIDIVAAAPRTGAGEYVGFLHATDRLSALAPRRLEAAIRTEAPLIYGDEDQIDRSGRRFAPWFKPDFGEDLFLSQNGFGRAVLFRRSVLEQLKVRDVGDLDDAIYDLALQTIARSGRNPLHCPGILVHVAGDPRMTPKARCLHLPGGGRRAAVESFVAERPALAGATVEGPDARGFLRLRHPLPGSLPLASVVIPTRDRKDLLERCIRGLDEQTRYRAREIIIVDNDSREAETRDYFAALSQRPDIRIIPAPGPFNYPRLINLGAGHARGEILVTLNNDIEAVEPDWLHEMVAHALRPDVGVVGCLLLYPDRSVQHAGVIIGLSGVAGHMYADAAPDDPGYAGRILAAQDLSAVTGACQVMRLSVFRNIGGLDERNLAVAYNDIDFCLRVRQAGLRVIYTPHARLLHRHSASRGSDIRPERLAGFTWEREYMRTRWAHVIFDDPFFNPNLSLSGKRGRLATAPRPRLLDQDQASRAFRYSP